MMFKGSIQANQYLTDVRQNYSATQSYVATNTSQTGSIIFVK